MYKVKEERIISDVVDIDPTCSCCGYSHPALRIIDGMCPQCCAYNTLECMTKWECNEPSFKALDELDRFRKINPIKFKSLVISLGVRI